MARYNNKEANWLGDGKFMKKPRHGLAQGRDAQIAEYNKKIADLRSKIRRLSTEPKTGFESAYIDTYARLIHHLETQKARLAQQIGKK